VENKSQRLSSSTTNSLTNCNKTRNTTATMFPSALLRFHALWSITSNTAVQSVPFGNHSIIPGIASVVSVVCATATLAWLLFASSTLIIKWSFCFCRTATVYLSHHPHPPTMRVGFKSDDSIKYQEIISNDDMHETYDLLELCRGIFDEMMVKHPLLFTDGSDIRELYRRCNAYHLPTDVFRLVDELDALDQLPRPRQAPKKKRVKKLDTLDGSYWTATPTKRRTRQTTKKSPTPSSPTPVVRRSARIAARNAVV